MWNTAHEHVLKLDPYEPGKPIEELAREYSLKPEEIIKLASNENPLGPSPLAINSMCEALKNSHRYPDGDAYNLRIALAKKHELPIQNIVLGNGSDEIIQFIGLAFLKPGYNIVISVHSFLVYKLVAQLFGAEVIEVPDKNYTVDLEEILKGINSKTRVVFIANPNNPTGTMVHQELIDEFINRVPHHVMVVFDEAYYEFLSDPPDVLKYVRNGKSVVVMRTFSKVMGMANLRIGYGMTNQNIASVLQRTRQPFNVNGIAQVGAISALEDKNHYNKTVELIHEGREYLQTNLTKMGVQFVPSVANFILVRVGDGNALFKAMLRKGIIIRAMVRYDFPEWIRVTIGTMDQNRRFLHELKNCLAV